MTSLNILNLLEPTATFFGLTAANAAEIITHLGNRLYEAGYVRDSFVAAALAREQELPTGLPLAGQVNAAIPHTDIEHVLKAGLALATLAEPVTFQNMAIPAEAVPVQLVFLLALDQPKAQIEMLQEIASLLQQPAVVARLMEAHDFEDVKTILSAT